MSLIFKDTDNKPIDPKSARTRAILLSVPFALTGIFALVLLVHDGLLGGLDRQKAMGLLSAAIVCGGLIALIFGITAKKESLKIGGSKTVSEKPWLGRKDWAAGRVTSASRKAVLLLWIFVAFWCIASTAIALVVLPQQLHEGNQAGIIALILAGISLVIIFFALKTTRAWRKFGRSVFKMTTVPAAAGGTLAGQIEVETNLQSEHGLHLHLSCVRRTMTGASNNRRTHQQILWQDEKWLRADLPRMGLNPTLIPVFFRLPGNLPDSTVSPGDGIHWKLEASAKLHGPDYHAMFEVPVFKMPDTPAAPEDTSLQYQISLDEIRNQIRSRIQVNDLPDGGKEFIFPAARNPGFASGATVICAVWTAVISLVAWKHAPLPFLLVVGAMDLLMMAYVFDLWFRQSRVAVNSKSATIQKAWLAFKNEQRLQRNEVETIESDIGANAGYTVYYDLKVRLTDGKEFVLAKLLNNKPEADWLVRQMLAALKPAATSAPIISPEL